MSMVAKFGAALAGSAMLTALGFGLVAGASIDLLFQPYFWIISVSLAGLFGLAMGTGSSSKSCEAMQMKARAARSGSMALAA
jgi:hypothetical protein